MSQIALVGGVFDPLHAGHIAYLTAAKQYGKVVCALSDAPHKHPPLVPIDQRKVILEALGVSSVIVHNFDDIASIIAAVQPTYYVKGADWVGRLPTHEREACHALGTVITYTTTTVASSSGLLADYETRRNASRLAAFEALVHGQRPVVEPWTPVTPYDRETRRQVETKNAENIARVFDGLTVLDYGCGFGYLVEMLCERGMDAVGWDPNPAHATDEDHLFKAHGVVICREVLEHVPMREWLNLIHDLTCCAKRFVYLTTRFTSQTHAFAVDGADGLDPTHISMVNQDYLRSLFVLHGLRRRADLEASLDWAKKGRCLVYEVVR